MGPPHENAKACPVNAVGAGHWPSRRGASAIPEPTLIRLASLGTFPLEGGRLAGGHMGPPLRRIWKRFLLFRRGRTLAGPPVNGLLSELRRRGHTPGWLLSAFGRFTFSPSPAVLKKLFRNWVGESLGAPAVNYSGPKVALIRLAYARHLLTGREKAFGRLIAAPTNRGERS